MGAQAIRFYENQPDAAESAGPKRQRAMPRRAKVAPAGHDHEQLEQWAADELSHALAHEWLELESLTPWSDLQECDPDAGRPYEVVRSYRWSDVEGGDMVCEVTVYAAPDRSGHFVRRRCVIHKS